jgi:hypothetical protein
MPERSTTSPPSGYCPSPAKAAKRCRTLYFQVPSELGVMWKATPQPRRPGHSQVHRHRRRFPQRRNHRRQRNLYGTTQAFGADGYGVAFAITP